MADGKATRIFPKPLVLVDEPTGEFGNLFFELKWAFPNFLGLFPRFESLFPCFVGRFL